MTPAAFVFHLANFVAPAFFLALVLALAGRAVMGKAPARMGWLARFAVTFLAGVAVLAGGLAFFGRDGMMATYAALVVVSGTVQWLVGGGFRR